MPKYATDGYVAATYVADEAGTRTLTDDDLYALAQYLLTAAQTTPINADVRKINAAPVVGVGSAGDKWRGV